MATAMRASPLTASSRPFQAKVRRDGPQGSCALRGAAWALLRARRSAPIGTISALPRHDSARTRAPHRPATRNSHRCACRPCSPWPAAPPAGGAAWWPWPRARPLLAPPTSAWTAVGAYRWESMHRWVPPHVAIPIAASAPDPTRSMLALRPPAPGALCGTGRSGRLLLRPLKVPPSPPCTCAGWIYDGAEPFDKLPASFKCPVCRSPKRR